MSEDLIQLAMREAVNLFGNEGDGMFNAACFSKAFMKLLGLNGRLDGQVVRGMLQGRQDVEQLEPGNAHFRLKSETRTPSRTAWQRMRI